MSFFSPCVLPLLPGYLSYVSGVAAQDLESARRGRLLAGSLLFVLGFSTVFVLGGALFGSVGLRLEEHQHTLSIVTGILVIVMGLVFIGLVPLMQREARVHAVPDRRARHRTGAGRVLRPRLDPVHRPDARPRC